VNPVDPVFPVKPVAPVAPVTDQIFQSGNAPAKACILFKSAVSTRAMHVSRKKHRPVKPVSPVDPVKPVDPVPPVKPVNPAAHFRVMLNHLP